MTIHFLKSILLVLRGAAGWRRIHVRYYAENSVVLLPLLPFHYRIARTPSTSLRLGLKSDLNFIFHEWFCNLTTFPVSFDSWEVSSTRICPSKWIDICPRKDNLLSVSSYFMTIWEPSTPLSAHCVLHWISTWHTTVGKKSTSSTEENFQSWKTSVKWKTTNGPNCVRFIYSSRAFQPRNSIHRVINLQAEKWVEGNFLKEVIILIIHVCRIPIKFFALLYAEYGKAFFDFFYIKNCIERNNEETPLLWAVENVNSYHIIISRFWKYSGVFESVESQIPRHSLFL